MKGKLYIVLPAYNEELGIARLLTRINSNMEEANIANFEVIVVNDGSKDRTREILLEYKKKIPLTILTHEVNKGLGMTIRDGLYHAAEVATGPNDIVVSMDADDTHTPGLIPRMMQMIREGHDVVIASRYQKGARVFGLSWFRRQMSNGASYLFRILLPIKGVKDFTCGFRAYRADVLQSALKKYGQSFIDQEGFQCMVDILLKLRSMDLIFGEAPFILRYDLKEGDSKMNVKKTVADTLKLIIKRKLSAS